MGSVFKTMNEENKTITLSDTYEAAFHMTHGASIKSLATRRIAADKEKRVNYRSGFIIELEGIKDKYIHQWKSRRAYVNARDFADARLRLKKKMLKVRNAWKKA